MPRTLRREPDALETKHKRDSRCSGQRNARYQKQPRVVPQSRPAQAQTALARSGGSPPFESLCFSYKSNGRACPVSKKGARGCDATSGGQTVASWSEEER